MTTTYAKNRGYDIVRNFALGPEAVFRAWTDPEHLGWFFNPEMPLPEPARVDLRVGGAWRQVMAINDETRYVTGGIDVEIEANRRLSFYWGAIDGWPKLDPLRLENAPLVTVVLTPKDGGTEMTFSLRMPDHLSDKEVDAFFALALESRWTQTLERLVDALAVQPTGPR